MSHYQNFTPPFEIPDSWEWVRLDEVGLWQSGATPSKSNPKYYGKGYPWLNTGDLNDGIIHTIPKEITEQAMRETSVKLNPRGSVLMAMYGATIGKLGILDIDATTNQACCACYKYWINSRFLFYFLLSWRTKFLEMGGGGAQPNISKEKIESTYMPCPPLQEQERIVNQVDAFFEILFGIESHNTRLDVLIESAKSKILGLAIQGKLVPQDPADEPAADMLLRINPKAKIITDNPHSWKIPSGWCITDLKSIGKWQSGATPSRMNPNYYGKGIPWLNTGDLTDGEIYNIPKEITELALKETSVKLNPSGSILIAMYGATIGKLGILTFEATTNQACCACAKCFIFNKFLFHFLKHHRPTFIKIGGGGAQSNISKEKIENTVLYLPPLNEQKRIVAKIEELYSVLDEIESSLQS